MSWNCIACFFFISLILNSGADVCMLEWIARLGEEWIAVHCQFLIPLIFELWWRHSGVCWIRRRMNCHVFEFPWFFNYDVLSVQCERQTACLPFFHWGLFASPRIFNSTYAQKAFFPINSPDDDDASSGQQSQVSSKLHATSSQTDGVCMSM